MSDRSLAAIKRRGLRVRKNGLLAECYLAISSDSSEWKRGSCAIRFILPARHAAEFLRAGDAADVELFSVELN